MKLKKAIEHDITIRATQNGGFIVKIGCAEFGVGDTKQLISQLTEYLKNPGEHDGNYRQEVQTEQPAPYTAQDVAPQVKWVAQL